MTLCLTVFVDIAVSKQLAEALFAQTVGNRLKNLAQKEQDSLGQWICSRDSTPHCRRPLRFPTNYG